MRENRPSGSEGGGTEANRSSLPLSPPPTCAAKPGHPCVRGDSGGFLLGILSRAGRDSNDHTAPGFGRLGSRAAGLRKAP